MARFAPIAPNPYLGQRNAPKTSSSVIRYYAERQPLLKNMSEVIGTTTAPSAQHQFAGTTPDGYAIWKKAEPAPAPSGGGGGGGGGGGSAPAAPQLQISEAAKKYREEADAKLAEAQKLLDDFKIEQNKAAEAKKLQEQMAIRAQGTLASNLAMSQRKPSLQLSPASQTPQTAGTQPFKRRRLQVMTPGSQVTSGLNIGSANLLNV